MATKLQFSKIKKELTPMVNNVIRQFLENKVYDRREAQSWCDGINDEIKKALSQHHQRGFKFIIHSTISKKGESSLHFSNKALWNQKTDGTIFVKYENATIKCFVTLFGIASEKNPNSHYQLGSHHFN